jgi:DNA-binding IclR family transcriptional regulator
MDEIGGKRFAEDTILRVLEGFDGANPSLVSTVIGLPVPIVKRLLYNLEDQNFVRLSVDGRRWTINEEMFLV